MSMLGPQQTFQLALQHHQAGRLREAERLYRQLLSQFPKHPDTLRNLGILLHQAGQSAQAIDLLRRAIALKPGVANAHNNLGEALRVTGKLDEALREYEAALRIKPDYPEALNNLGGALMENGQTELGIERLRRALELRPGYAKAMVNLGNALGIIDRHDEAIEMYAATAKLDAKNVDVQLGLGQAMRSLERWDESLAAYSAALSLAPDNAEAYAGASACLLALRRHEEAAQAIQTAIRHRPDHAAYHNQFGELARKAGMLDAAVDAYRKALSLNPNLAEAHNNLALAIQVRGEQAEALKLIRRAVELAPTSTSFHSNLLMAMNYTPHEPREIFEEHQRWGRTHAKTSDKPMHASCRGDDPERPLRIGYVSPDLRRHPVATFLEPMLVSRDREKFSVFAYSNTPIEDDVTERLRSLCDGWRTVNGLSDDAIARQIAADKIDVLVDLAGHTARHRLRIFARRPAPVQMTYLGYPNTTGIEAIDYRLTDAITDPPGEADAMHTEKLLRLPRCFLCFSPPEDGPEVGPLPAATNGYITFGAFNNFLKVVPETLAAWSEILRALPTARLRIKLPAIDTEATTDHVRALLAKHGLPVERVELQGNVRARSDFLARYHDVDLTLDTFPYNGTTTTCESLWMGAPVVAFAGRSHAARVSASILKSVGLDELVGSSRDEYVKLAIDLAQDVPRLANLRAGLRNRMRASPLLDAKDHARAVETDYRNAWRNACKL